MQKLPFDTIVRSIYLDKKKWVQFSVWLKEKGITFSKWVREKIEEELKKR